MPLSIFLAQVIGSYLFLVSLAMLIQPIWYKKVSNDLVTHPFLFTFFGSSCLILGLLIVVSHNVWISEWPVLVTIVGWIVFIQGLVALFAPSTYAKITKDLMNNMGHTLISWIRLGIGIVLIWAGFSNTAL